MVTRRQPLNLVPDSPLPAELLDGPVVERWGRPDAMAHRGRRYALLITAVLDWSMACSRWCTRNGHGDLAYRQWVDPEILRADIGAPVVMRIVLRPPAFVTATSRSFASDGTA